MDENLSNPATGGAATENNDPSPVVPKRPGMRLDGEQTEPIKNNLVVTGLRKTQILLAYGAENGVEFDLTDIRVFTHFKESVQAGSWTAQEETEFWVTYSNIARKMGDIKAKEIEAITVSDVPKNWIERMMNLRTSAAQRVANIYTITALFFVLLMLLIQVYSLIGNNLYNSAQEILTKIETLKEKRTAHWGTIIQNDGKVLYSFQEILAAEEANADSSLAKNPAYRDATFSLREVNKQLWEQNLELVTLVFSLNEWLLVDKDAEVQKLKEFYYTKDSVELQHGFFKELLYMNPEEAFAEHYDTIQMVIYAVKSPLDVMNIYILPLLYGLIGAFAFVLRSFTSQLENIDYSRDSNIKFLLRLFLGALVGLTVRMFIDTNDTSGLAMYSPLAISFISGYSVEFFFALIDNLIKRILGSDPKTSKKQDFSTES